MLTTRHQKVAATRRHERAVSLLLEAVGNSDKHRDHLANAQGGNDTIRGLLRDAINETDSQGRTVLMLVGDIRLELTDMLLEHGANPYILDLQGRTCLHHAAARGSPAVVLRLLRCGLDPNLADNDGWTPLFWAARGGRVKNLAFLIDAGGNPSIELKNGWTPLTVAVYHGKRDVLRILAEKSGPRGGIDRMQFPQRLKDSKTGVVQASLSSAICDGCELVSFHRQKYSAAPADAKPHQAIYGPRYRCSVCVDFDFCFKCINTVERSHPPHKFVERSHPPHKFVELIDRYRTEVSIPGTGFTQI